MSNLTIEVWDATGNKKQLVELPADAPVNRVIAVLVDKMNLPRYSPDGQLMSYKFHHKASGRQLLDDQTLASADIHSGDVLRLQPEITAGLGDEPWQPPVDSRGNEVLPVLRRTDPGGRPQVPLLRRVSRSGAARCRCRRARSTGLSCRSAGPASAIVAGYLGLLSLFPFFGITRHHRQRDGVADIEAKPAASTAAAGRGSAWSWESSTTFAYAVVIAIVAIGA